MNPVQCRIPALSDALSCFTSNNLQQAVKDKKVVDIRFSKSRTPEYNQTQKKNYVDGFSGWLLIDPIAKTILLTVITPNQPALYRTQKTIEPYDVATNIIKASEDYSFTFDDELRVSLVKTVATVTKRTYEQSWESIRDLRESRQIHQTVDQAYPKSIARAPKEHPTMIRPKGIRYETVQELYPADLGKVVYQKEKVELSLAERLTVCADVADSLSCIHQAGYIHNDPRVENILLESTAEGWRGRLTDFGQAKQIYEDDFKGAQYLYWDSLGKAGVFQIFTDIFGLSLTIGVVLWGRGFEVLATDLINSPVKQLATDLKRQLQSDGYSVEGLPTQNVHIAAYRLLERIIEEDDKLSLVYNNLPRSLSYREQLEKLEENHISVSDFAHEIRKLAELACKDSAN